MISCQKIVYFILLSLFIFNSFSNSYEAHNDFIDGTSVYDIRGDFLPEHSLVKPYHGAGIEGSTWSIIGSTFVSERQVRLTSNIQSLKGGIWNQRPCPYRDWELRLNFRVHGSTGNLFGDGMAFWYVKEANSIGNVFGSQEYFTGLAIFFDTYSNHNGEHSHSHPYISAMVSNGSLLYDHDSDGTHTSLGDGCELKFRNKEHDTQILVRYVGDELAVYTDAIGASLWKKCFSVPGVRLPASYYFGVSAATGDLSDNHDIISIHTYMQDFSRVESYGEEQLFANPYAENVAAPRDHVNTPKPSRLGWIGTTFLIIVAIVIVVVVLGFGLSIFQKRQELTRKRFY